MRYVTKAAYIETPMRSADWKTRHPDLSVEGRKEVDTGLVDKDGNPIYRLPPPIGFGRGE